MTKISHSKIARYGWLKVNLPVIIILIGSWLLLINFNVVNSRINALIAGAIGWVYWE
jgi:diacylglycerol kinase